MRPGGAMLARVPRRAMPSSVRRLAAAAGGAALLLVWLAGSPALAGPSPGISPSRIEIDEPVRQGDDVRLPSLSVSNRGDEASTFSTDATFLADQAERVAEQSWFSFNPSRFDLEAGAGTTVAVRMRVPRDATPGTYRALLRVRVDPASSGGGGAVISAAVAATLLFEVENRDFHFYDPVTDFISERAPFSYIGLGLLLALLAGYLIRRRLRLRISIGIERRE